MPEGSAGQIGMGGVQGRGRGATREPMDDGPQPLPRGGSPWAGKGVPRQEAEAAQMAHADSQRYDYGPEVRHRLSDGCEVAIKEHILTFPFEVSVLNCSKNACVKTG